MKIKLPYGKGFQETEISNERINGVLEASIEEYQPEDDQLTIVKKAMKNPINSKKLKELAVGKDKVVILISDHTRPVPSKYILPLMLKEIREGNPDADITLLVATGCHRGTTKEELIGKIGENIYKNEKIYIHDCDDESMLVTLDEKLPSGGNIIVNKLAAEADLLVAEGFIEPHFFAGYSGGRKSVFPGCCSRKAVMYNHNAEFIDSEYARTGNLENNPIHKDMIAAAKALGLVYIVNVVINSDKEVIHAVAGDLEKAHEAGTEWLKGKAGVDKRLADIAITSNGGYPLDQNIYQAVKSMTAAEATVKDGGVIIVSAESSDGTGGDAFYNAFVNEPDTEKLYQSFLDTPKEETIPDQWESQILCRVLLKTKAIIYISDVDDEIVKTFHMIPVKTLDEAMEKANELMGNDSSVTVIPNGISVFIK
ncbi:MULTISPECIES: nickel-dependent lactate racemase [Anaerococcus]|uniref:Nickel-dependent lactate racemase n=1 Tax=Anaerococcus nagyae TaxID=1755241 RepID=A0A3E2THA3_9FIRM|nr:MULTISPECIES: nickel-dependent lactate racemase [Anaerococcus]MDU2565736.1 nickel-dependent lactate racemase [Anaerococcus sp.]RGB75794.1 nickel-dependent lactate racemase [Anaerococcus nagyae]